MFTGPDDSNLGDRLCAGLAMACAVHCLQAFWLASVIPPLAGDTAHRIAALAVVVPGAPALLRGWSRHHSLRPWAWALPGWGLLLLARGGSPGSPGEIAETFFTAGGCVLAWVGHQLNRSLTYWHDRS